MIIQNFRAINEVDKSDKLKICKNDMMFVKC